MCTDAIRPPPAPSVFEERPGFKQSASASIFVFENRRAHASFASRSETGSRGKSSESAAEPLTLIIDSDSSLLPGTQPAPPPPPGGLYPTTAHSSCPRAARDTSRIQSSTRLAFRRRLLASRSKRRREAPAITSCEWNRHRCVHRQFNPDVAAR